MTRIMRFVVGLSAALSFYGCGDGQARTKNIESDGSLHYYACMDQGDGYRELVVNKTNAHGCYEIRMRDKETTDFISKVGDWWIYTGFLNEDGCADGRGLDSRRLTAVNESDAEIKIDEDELSGYLSLLFDNGNWLATYTMDQVPITTCGE